MDAKPKILIVDDKPENLVALRIVLKDLDIELVEATSGNEALKATLHHNFALALLDIQMPEMDGYELAGILREEEKTMHLPIIFISAVYTDNLNVFKGYEKGAFSFITKPFQPEILINKVKFFIDRHQQELA
ncbi:MAG TPA: response regulator, partial [Flavobacteriaceae bacterium]